MSCRSLRGYFKRKTDAAGVKAGDNGFMNACQVKGYNDLIFKVTDVQNINSVSCMICINTKLTVLPDGFKLDKFDEY